MLWEGIILDGRIHLLVLDNGSVTSVKCMDDILVPYVRLFRDAVGTNFILIDYNAFKLTHIW